MCEDKHENQSEVARRHAEIYGTRGLPKFNYDWVDTQILAGRNPLTAVDIAVLSDLGVTHLLDLREPHEWAAPQFGLDALHEIERRGLQRRSLPILDMGAPQPEEIEAACAYLSDVLQDESKRVFVHCRAGMERTAAILIAFYARRESVSYDQAFAILRRRRAIFCPLPNQEKAVRKWLK